MKRWKCYFGVVALGLLCLGGIGCSTFNLDWDAARALPKRPDDLSGRWIGTWKSDVNGHSGQLRCLVSQTATNQYEARFHALYPRGGLTLSFSYAVPLRAEQAEPGKWKFTGDANLGWYAGGLYTYTGQATPTNFFSLYDCKYDRGIFSLTRPAE